MPISPERALFLSRRMKELGNEHSAPMQRKLCSLGGEYLVPMPESATDTKRVMERGLLFTPHNIQVQPGQPSACHANSAALYLTHAPRYTLCTGYGLSDDGLWRQHSWVMDTPKNTLIETTQPRTQYFGVTLRPIEALYFAVSNAEASVVPNQHIMQQMKAIPKDPKVFAAMIAREQDSPEL